MAFVIGWGCIMVFFKCVLQQTNPLKRRPFQMVGWAVNVQKREHVLMCTYRGMAEVSSEDQRFACAVHFVSSTATC